MSNDDNIIYVDFNRTRRRQRMVELQDQCTELTNKGQTMLNTATAAQLEELAQEVTAVRAEMMLLKQEEEKYGNYKYFN